MGDVGQREVGDRPGIVDGPDRLHDAGEDGELSGQLDGEPGRRQGPGDRVLPADRRPGPHQAGRLHQQVRLDAAQQGLDIALAGAVELDEVHRAVPQRGEQACPRGAPAASQVRQGQPPQTAGLNQAGGHLEPGVAGADDQNARVHG